MDRGLRKEYLSHNGHIFNAKNKSKSNVDYPVSDNDSVKKIYSDRYNFSLHGMLQKIL